MKIRLIARILISAMLLIVGTGHFIVTDNMTAMVPDFLPWKHFWVLATGVAELLLAIGLWIPATRRVASWLTILMLVLYLPLHIVDVMRPEPVIGPVWVAIIRIPMQGVLIWLAWLAGRDGQRPGK